MKKINITERTERVKNREGGALRITFSSNLRRLRGLQNISQVALAKKIGVTPNFINDIENCKKWMSPQTIAKLAVALNVEPYQFFLPELKERETRSHRFCRYLDDFADAVDALLMDLRRKYFGEEPESPDSAPEGSAEDTE
ncbi:MAG: helix-turn-helix transcriptional regulator [Spirochaetaceae bacterium]|jgi:transcriptional regulator with XRE-family HTH domain|nr:helix-turn-helix transcriptional regulator [Spirochaetaceae bacterium]